LRDARRAAGAVDADRWTAELLVTTTGHGGRKLGAVLTPVDAERWWPLFAERLDLADEYLDGGDGRRHPDDDVVDTTAMILTILERFPVVPEPLVPRLAALALGESRHRPDARRAHGDDPRTLAAVRDALSDAGEASPPDPRSQPTDARLAWCHARRHDPARRPGRVLRVGRAAAGPCAARPAGSGRWWPSRGRGARRVVRGQGAGGPGRDARLAGGTALTRPRLRPWPLRRV